MKDKQKLLALLGSAVIFGLSSQGIPSFAGEGRCAGMNKGMQQKTKEASCGGMQKQGEMKCAGMKKDKEKEEEKKKKKSKEMACGGMMTCAGRMNSR